MLTINGDTLITSDWHFGLNGDSDIKFNILSKAIDKMFEFIKENKIKNLIFCGDFFHNRVKVDSTTRSKATDILGKLAEECNIYLIIGNHDIPLKNSNDDNSLKGYDWHKNISVIIKPTECSINGNKTLLVPWNTNFLDFEKNSYDMMLGHFDIGSQFLSELYIEKNIQKRTSKIDTIKNLEQDSFLNDLDISDLDFNVENTTDSIVNGKRCSDLIGNWVDLVKPKGTIFSGHIHNRSEHYINNRKLIIIGSPYQQTLNEKDSEDGFYTLNKNNEINFHKLEGVPVFKEFKISDIVKDLDNFDFSIFENNILHRINDITVDKATDEKIKQKIEDIGPIEQLDSNPCPTNKIFKDENGNTTSVNSINKSILNYINDFINKLNKKVLKENNINPKILYNMLEEYYNNVNEEG